MKNESKDFTKYLPNLVMVSDFSFLVVTSITVAKVSRHYFRHHIVTGKEFSVITHFRLLPPSFWCASPVLTLPYHKIPQTVWLKPQKLIFSQFRRLEVPGQGPVGWASGEPSSLSLCLSESCFQTWPFLSVYTWNSELSSHKDIH